MVLTSSAGEKIIYPDQKITPISNVQKWKGAGVTLAKAGGITALTAFIPVLHFVLVPLGILVTAAMSYMAFQKKYELENFEVHCPHCDKKSQMTVAGASLPLRTFCSHCRHMVYLNN